MHLTNLTSELNEIKKLIKISMLIVPFVTNENIENK